MDTKKYFTDEGIKALEKMATEGAKGASESLSKLINQSVQVKTLHVRATPIERVSEFIAEPEALVTTVTMELSGDVYGQIMLIYPKQSAINIADFLAKRPLGKTLELDELDKSALKESGNIIAGSFLAAISDYLDINMIESIPDLANDMLGAIVESVVARFMGKQIAESVAMEINFGLATGAAEAAAEKIAPEIATQGYFIILLDIESAAKVMSSLKGISGGEKMTE